MNKSDANLVDLAAIRRRLQSVKPETVNPTDRNEAAVSLMLSVGPQGTEMLLIERAHRDGDPWSGQMAFPGGRREHQDSGVFETAIRETAEETGIELESENFIARIDDLVAPRLSHAHGLIISCHVFECPRFIQFTPNEEVHDVIWVPLNSLIQPEHHTENYQPPNYDGEFAGFKISDDDHRVIWGLTYRIISSFFRILGLSRF